MILAGEGRADRMSRNVTLKDPVPEGYKATIDPPDVTQFVAASEKLE